MAFRALVGFGIPAATVSIASFRPGFGLCQLTTRFLPVGMPYCSLYALVRMVMMPINTLSGGCDSACH